MSKNLQFIFPVIFVVIFFLAPGIFPQSIPVERKFTLNYDTTTQYHFENLTLKKPETIKVGLVFSGGGARGMSHIGVLKALVENNIPVDLIVGCSVGSIVGGFYAAGYNANSLSQIMRQINWQEIYSDETYRNNLFWSQKSTPRRHILELRFDRGIPYIPSAISPGQRVFDLIYSYLLRANFQAANNFNNLKIPFRAVATDLISGKKIVLRSGDLAEAISASVAVPLLFAPVKMNGMWLVDGGIRDNLPVDVALESGADLVIAVDVTSPLRTKNQMHLPWQVADQVTNIMMKEPTAQSRQLADILIKPRIGEHSAGDFSNVDSLIEAGYKATLGQIDSIREKIRLKHRVFEAPNRYLGKVDSVQFVGAKNALKDSIIDKLDTQPGRSLYSYDIYQDLSLIFESGYVGDAFVILKGDAPNYTVEFNIKTNPVIHGVNFIGNKLFPDSVLNQHFHFISNRILNSRQLISSLNSVQNYYYKMGYSLARVTNVQYDPLEKELNIYLDEGKITKVIIEGNRVTKKHIILREFPLKDGTYFKADLAQEGIRDIYSTELFNRVNLGVERKNSENILIIKVQEKKYTLLRLGANASIERKGNALLELREDNALGMNTKASLTGIVGDLERQAEFQLFSVRLFNTYLTYRLSAYYDERWDDYYNNFHRAGTYLTIRRGLLFMLGQQIEKLGSITAELRMDGVNIYSGYQPFPYREGYRIRSLAFRSVVDKRDKLPFPDKGINNRWFWETGNQLFLKSSKAFTRFYLSLEGYYPITGKLNYHVVTAGGSADLTLPFSEFFTLGGIQDFPGLHQKEKIGRQFIKVGNELRYKIPWSVPMDFYVTGKFFIGAVWQTSEDPIRRSDFMTSEALSLALNSVLGPVRLSYSYLNGHNALIYFSIGYQF